MSTEAKPCPKCGEAVEPHKLYIWHVSCADCYDGAPDAGVQLHGFAETEAGAVARWNERVDDWEAERLEALARIEAEKEDEYAYWREINRRIDLARGK